MPTISPAADPPYVCTFVIPVRNDAVGLSRCLASIRRSCASVPVEIVVVDNGSTDRTVEVARHAGTRVLSMPGARVSALRNAGAAVATSDVLAFVDADHEIGDSWCATAVRVMHDSAVAAAGAPYLSPPSPSWVQRAYDGLRDHSPDPRLVPWLGSGNLLVRKHVFQRVGGFDTRLEACEDVDFCRRIRAGGDALLCEPGLQSVHYGDPVSLRLLFRSELWRGRNNLQVSLREPLTLRSAPSVVIPVAQLGLLLAAVLVAVTGRFPLLLLLAVLYIFPAVLRTALIRRRTRVAFAQAFAVSLVYDTARALALCVRAGHRRATLARQAA